jgi:hypothetical protein
MYTYTKSLSYIARAMLAWGLKNGDGEGFGVRYIAYELISKHCVHLLVHSKCTYTSCMYDAW